VCERAAGAERVLHGRRELGQVAPLGPVGEQHDVEVGRGDLRGVERAAAGDRGHLGDALAVPRPAAAVDSDPGEVGRRDRLVERGQRLVGVHERRQVGAEAGDPNIVGWSR